MDFGKVRTGIAVTDELQLIASGLNTVPTENLISFLAEYLNKEPVEKFVVGLPLQMDGTPSESEADIQKFLKTLSQKFPQIPIEREDERFTSKMAMKTMIEGGVKKKKRRNKAKLDEISATLILQAYLNRS